MPMTEDELFLKRLSDLSNQSFRTNSYTFTNFLNPNEYSLFLTQKDFPVKGVAFGGYEDAERVVVRFGSEEDFGYVEEFPIALLEIRPGNQKFADELTHRDLLGALMHLGIERSMLGDILIKENVAYVFCLEQMTEFILSELTKVKHTIVCARKVQELPGDFEPERTFLTVQTESERLDAVIAKVYNLSRSQSIELFRAKKIFVNNRQEENNSGTLKDDSTVSVRGYGKFIYHGISSVSKKGKLNLNIEKFGK